MIVIDESIVPLTKKEMTLPLAIDYVITNEDSQIEEVKDDFFLFRG